MTYHVFPFHLFEEWPTELVAVRPSRPAVSVRWELRQGVFTTRLQMPWQKGFDPSLGPGSPEVLGQPWVRETAAMSCLSQAHVQTQLPTPLPFCHLKWEFLSREEEGKEIAVASWNGLWKDWGQPVDSEAKDKCPALSQCDSSRMAVRSPNPLAESRRSSCRQGWWMERVSTPGFRRIMKSRL